MLLLLLTLLGPPSEQEYADVKVFLQQRIGEHLTLD
jgi:hypothetical protein